MKSAHIILLAATFLFTACDRRTEIQLETLTQPEVRASSGGTLSTTITMSEKNHDIGVGLALVSSSYDGGIPGPTLELRPGDNLQITLVNNIPMPGDAMAGTDPRVSNLHFHGLHVSPLGNSDNPLVEVGAGGSFTYNVAIPSNHPAGTFWYHPHHHGHVAWQVANGMQGALIVRGDVDAIPAIAAARERILMLANIKLDPATGRVPVMSETGMDLFLVNGKVRPVFTMRPGEVQRWRILAGSGSRYFPLQLDGHELHQIAFDGITLPAVQPTTEAMLIPGQRTDVLVRAGAPGRYMLRKMAHQNGLLPFVPEHILAEVVVEGAPVTMALPTTLLPMRPDPGVAGVQRNWSFDIISEFPMVTGVNMQPFSAAVVSAQMHLGSVEEWTIIDGVTTGHPFHLHTNHFLVTHVNGQPLAQPYWRDTVNVPPAGQVTVKIPFDDFIGPNVFHCHILEHEDTGMMARFDVLAQPGSK